MGDAVVGISLSHCVRQVEVIIFHSKTTSPAHSCRHVFNDHTSCCCVSGQDIIM